MLPLVKLLEVVEEVLFPYQEEVVVGEEALLQLDQPLVVEEAVEDFLQVQVVH